MNTFANAVRNQSARTLNGMKARASTANPAVDLFFKIGASRGQNIIPDFTAARAFDTETALRIALWARDVRGGAGERKLFRDILLDLETSDRDSLMRILPKVPEMGRWDDLLLDWKSVEVKGAVVDLIRNALTNNNGLCAKWMPRKGEKAVALRTALGWTPKFYRKRLVELTKVVESQMCAKEWDKINYSHVPSVASSRYKKAFNRHTPDRFKAYVEALAKGDPSVKVNASAIYPYDVLRGLSNVWPHQRVNYTREELMHLTAQWEALPNYVGDANILPLVDVSGSMWCPVGGDTKSGLQCIDIAVSLGLYCADKNKGKFKDTFLTFSSHPELLHLKGNIFDKVKQMNSSDWGGSTDIIAAFRKILQVAKEGNVPQEEMPHALLIMSDMQFNYCADFDDSAMESIERQFTAAGYTVPAVVFWNINAYSNVPVSFEKRGTALVSGFSPTILKSVLAADFTDMTPEGIMKKTVYIDRYNV